MNNWVYPQGNHNALYADMLRHIWVAAQPGTVGTHPKQSHWSRWSFGVESVSHYDVTLIIRMRTGWTLWMREVPERVPACMIRDSILTFTEHTVKLSSVELA